MPVYDYKCTEHGVFFDLATVAQSSEPCACPSCGTLSSRVIMIAPEVLAMAPAKRTAIKRNEEAKHKPIISTEDSRAEAADRANFANRSAQRKHNHHKGCGCSHEHASTKTALKKQVVLLADGSKVFPSQRPWMISH